MADLYDELAPGVLDDKRLLRAVKSFPVIWNPTHRFYRHSDKKNKAWDEIVLVHFDGLSVDECRKRWLILRDGFRRNLRTRKIVDGVNVSRPWRYEKQMEFLIPYYQNSYSPKHKSEDDELLLVNEPEYTEEDASSSMDDHEAAINKRAKIWVGEDHLSKFFFAMESAVRVLPPKLQVEVKKQIFQVVSDAEISAITNGQFVSAETEEAPHENPVEYVLSIPEENYTTVTIKPEGD